MDVLAANDQENLVRNLQAGPAGKPLHAGLKSTNKAPKTPFKVPLNDENAVTKGGKSILKTVKASENALVTPAGPRTRAPLGMKTTNAKTKAFQTPGPLSGSAKTTKLSPRLRRPKVKVHQPEVQAEEDDVLEVEYMPPREVPLPDNLDEDMPPINWDFPMFKGANMTRGYHSVYHNPVEDDGRTRGERELEESLAREKKKANEEFDKLFAEIMDKEEAEAKRYLGIESEPPKKAAPQELPTKKMPAPSTMRARSAAAALSPVKARSTAPSAIPKSKIPTGMIAGRKPANPTINPSASRNAAAAAASRSTIGYAQGRIPTTTARKPLSNVARPPSNPTLSKRPTTASSIRSRAASANSISSRTRAPLSRSCSASTAATLVGAPQEDQRTAADIEREMALLALQEDDEEGIDAWMDSFRSQLNGDALEDDFDGFQLQLPEGF